MHKDQVNALSDKILKAFIAEGFSGSVIIYGTIFDLIADAMADAAVLELPDFVNQATRLEIKRKIIFSMNN